MWLKIASKIISIGGDIMKQRLLNKHTPKGVVLLLSGAYSFGYLNQEQVNFLLLLLSNVNLSTYDLYLFLLNIIVIFILYLGCFYVFAKVKQKVK